MRTVSQFIRSKPVWVNPDHSAETATVLMLGHHLDALPVMEGPALVGMVLDHQLLGAEPQSPVGDLMRPDVPAASPDISVRAAAQIMTESGLDHLAVVGKGRLMGVVADGDLLPELGRSYDPLTELPWADTLREWAIDRLMRGHEITVLFIDLDGFGLFNKRLGHIVGDEVLKATAAALLEVTDGETDMLCRYGGDEFAIATQRSADEAAELGAQIRRRVAEIHLPSLGAETITCTIGQFGGKRTREREHTHYAATLNSLINLASRDCMAKKAAHGAGPWQGAEGAPSTRAGRILLARAGVEHVGSTTKAQVVLELAAERGGGGVARYAATRSAQADEEGELRLVVEAAVCAVRSLLPPEHDLAFTDLITCQTAQGDAVLTFVGRLITPQRPIPVAGSALATADPHRAAAAAVLAGVNRLLERILT